MNSSDILVGLTLAAVLAGYALLNHTQATPDKAVLGEISLIMNDLELELKKVEGYRGIIPPGTKLHTLLGKGKNTALIGQPGDAFLIPDITQKNGAYWLGGCLIPEGHWALLRLDQSALTGIPEAWNKPVIKLCLDLNGARGPNQEGYDVIRLSFSRYTSPHITLIPASAAHTQED